MPGKDPKPPLDAYHDLLWRCLREGLRRGAPELERDADGIDFRIANWNPLYYDGYRDPMLDEPWVARLLGTPGPSQADRDDANSFRRRYTRFMLNLGDRFPVLIRVLRDPWVRASIAETQRYFSNTDGVGSQIRAQVKRELTSAGGPLLLIGHSLGSVIAYDALWELQHSDGWDGRIDTLVTLGSPLGLHFVQARLHGSDRHGADRYPGNVRHWINIAAIGELTALDPSVADDFRGMAGQGAVEHLEDITDIYNFYRDGGGLNVHRSYGYLVNPAVGRVVARWLAAVAEGERGRVC